MIRRSQKTLPFFIKVVSAKEESWGIHIDYY